MNYNILVVDNEKELADVIELYLTGNGCTVYKCCTGAEALDCIAHTDLDLAILDVMLPDADGFQICRKIREKFYFPIIMLTAKTADVDKITGLSIGAGDYIAAPVFSADYQSGADDILRCTRYGRVSLGMAKLFTALLISTAAFVICVAVHILAADSLFGWECTRTSVQMMYTIVTLADMDIGGLQFLFAVAGMLSVLASVSFTLFLSARCRTTVSSLASSLVFCIAPVVISMTAPGALGICFAAFCLPAEPAFRRACSTQLRTSSF